MNGHEGKCTMRCRWGISVFSVLFLLAAMTASAADVIVRSERLPETTPWDLKQLSEVPAFEWVDQKSSVRSLFYAGEPYGGKATRVFAYYASPTTLSASKPPTEKFPAVVLIHGGGGTAFREWAELWAKRGYAAIAMDLAGHRPNEGQNAHQPANRTRLPDGGPNQGDDEKFGSIDKLPTEQWSYHAVAAAIRGHSLIRSFPEVDAKRTAVTGISWGGYLTCIVAGLDSRFKAAVPVYGCGFLHDNSAWLSRFEKMSPEQRQRWVTLWDPSKYLPAVSMPILFVNGTNDFAYPLDSYMKSFDAVPGTKQLRVSVNLPHGHPPGWAPTEIGLFIDQHLGRGPALPKLSDPKIENSRVRVDAKSETKLKQASLHYTTDGDAINKRTWKTAAATIDGNTITVEAAPAEATVWFITVIDERDALVSSRIMIR